MSDFSSGLRAPILEWLRGIAGKHWIDPYPVETQGEVRVRWKRFRVVFRAECAFIERETANYLTTKEFTSENFLGQLKMEESK